MTTLGDPPNVRDLIARTLADHTGGEGTWDRLTAETDPRMELTSQERARRAQAYRDAAEAVREVMFSVPCGSCHPCQNWVDERWRQAGRKPPYPEDWDATRARLFDVEEIARSTIALSADLLRRYGKQNPGQLLRTCYETRTQIEQWGRQVLAWQDQLDKGPDA